MKPFKITLKLNPEASPHLYVRRINELIAEDEYLHPMLKGLLLTLKKARMSFVRLSLEKEMVITSELYCHFERATSPNAMPYNNKLINIGTSKNLRNCALVKYFKPFNKQPTA